MILTLNAKLLDSQTMSIPGTLSLADNGLSFASSTSSLSITIAWSDIRVLTIANIGKRERNGPFIEFTIYHTDVQRLYTFSEVISSEKNELMNVLSNYLDSKVRIVERSYATSGWNWGTMTVSSAAVSFIPNTLTLEAPKRVDSNAKDALGGADSNEEAGIDVDESSSTEDAQINEDPVEDLYFHLPTSMIEDFKSLGARDISLTLQASANTSKSAMAVKEIVFTLPDRQTCAGIYESLTQVIDKRSSGRIISIPELSVFTTKSSKFALEINIRSLRFFSGNNNYHRMPDTISRYFLVEKPNSGGESSEYYFVIFFTSGNGFTKGLDSICILLPQRKITRELILPEDQDIADALCQEMLCDNPRIYDEENPPYGPYSLLTARDVGMQAYGSGPDRHIAKLNGVETYLVVPRLFRYLTPKKTFICTDNSQNCLDKKAYSPTTYNSIKIRDGYSGQATLSCVECKNRITQQKTVYLYFLDRRQGLLMLPYSPIYIPYSSITRVTIESDTSRSTVSKRNSVKIVVSTVGTIYEFTSIDREHCDVIEQYLQNCGVSVSVSLQAANRGRSGTMGDQEFEEFNGEDDSADEDFEAAPESSSDDYSEEFEEVDSDESEANEHHDHEVQALKARTERTKKRAIFECYADIRSQDCLLPTPNPSTW